MTEILESVNATWLLPALVVLLVVWFIYRRRVGGDHLQRVLKDIAYARIEGLVVPDSDDGEIQIDYLLLTSRGLLILHIKDVQGVVFGSDKMQDWTVISKDRRFTFSNPQPALYDRIAAVRQIVRQVPVEGRVLFLDGAEFTKGVPSMVCKVEAFKPHWEVLQKNALGEARTGAFGSSMPG